MTPGAAGPLVAGTAQAFEAKVLDAAGQPVSGVALQFAVTGSNSYSNTGSTNTNGLVTFSYNGTNTGLDVARVTATSLTGVAPATANCGCGQCQCGDLGRNGALLQCRHG